MKTQLFKIAGMSCNQCEINLESALMEKDGVVSVTVSFKECTVLVQYDSKRVSTDALKEAIISEGFHII
ncbi:heavy-metal-associated domain-containing protein [Bacillus massilinigeriensis]|uniref:heavy-metal-associated domain-containing protein n=1 Tax=Bacillus mediterraneensis TaxID=1805474 RepID=UPI0008F8C563|nr:heavy-metal-associated domain-containing protein [Bacillus mediterraneensis]